MDRFVRISKHVEWSCVCEDMEDHIPELRHFLEVWGSSCGAPYAVFRGQLCRMLLDIWEADKIEKN